MSTTNQHGGNIDAIKRTYGILKDQIIDFSGNVNPLGAPPSVLHAVMKNLSVLSHYPDACYVDLRAAAAAYAGVSQEAVLVGNGATELIALFIKTQVCAGQKAVVVAPAYSEYEREINNALCGLDLFPLEETDGFNLNVPKLLVRLSSDAQTKLLVMCNPNNPTGTAVPQDDMIQILDYCIQRGICVMVDETYVEFAADDSLSAAGLVGGYPNLFVIRGTSKLFAVPGLRLGYALCGCANTRDKINTYQNPWSVNTLADIAGRVMFADKSFIAQTRALILTEKQKIRAILETWPNIRLYDSHANFMLVKLLENCPHTSSEIFEKLIQQRLLIRDCAAFSFLGDRFIRFCILMPKENEMLLAALKRLIC